MENGWKSPFSIHEKILVNLQITGVELLNPPTRSEPFMRELEGREVAVLLMDTQALTKRSCCLSPRPINVQNDGNYMEILGCPWKVVL